jgi:penicillin-binding protein 1A
LASVDPATGKIVALAGTENYNQTKFFYPVQAQRQTGSAAKVFALMTLIHDYDGSPDSTYYTSRPLAAGWDPAAPDWSVHTDDNTYSGSISVAHATTVSDNTVFAQLVTDLGVSKFEAVARSMGLPASQMIGAPAEVLGGWKNGITTLQMAAADGVLASGGTYTPPTIVDHVSFPDGSTDNWAKKKGTQVFSSGETYAATQVLKTVIQSGTGTSANYGCPAAGKTGTAENLANAWFVGYTPKLATAVWVGYPSGNISLGSEGFGGTMAAPLWKQFMETASDGYCGDFTPPSSTWSGTAFSGAYSSGGSASSRIPNSSSSGRYTSGGSGSANPYDNRSLYAQPPQAAPPSPTTGATGTTGGAGGGTTSHTGGSGAATGGTGVTGTGGH